MSEKQNKIAQKIITEIETGAASRWFNPYKAPPIQNLVSGWRYKSKNMLSLLSSTNRQDGYCPFFLTFNQAQNFGGLKKGCRAAGFVTLCISKQKDAVQMAIDAAELDDLEGEELAAELNAASFKRSFCGVQMQDKPVFSALDLVDVPSDVVKWSNALKSQSFDVLKQAVPDLFTILKKSGVPVKVGGGVAFYSPKEDCIILPSPAACKGGVGVYCSMALHELTHSFCQRAGNNGNNGYNLFGRRLEEMVAEFGALLLCNALRLPYNPSDRHSSLHYIKSWGGAKWRDLVPAAIQEAQKRADYIINIIDGDNGEEVK